MIFEFGKIQVQVDYAHGIREREASTVGYTLFRVTLKVPDRKPLIRTTWKGESAWESEEKRMRRVALEFMYSLVQAWARPQEYLRSEVSWAERYAKDPEDQEEVEEKKNLAKELIRYAAEIDPFMDAAVEGLWKHTRRDDERRTRGPREWFPPKVE